MSTMKRFFALVFVLSLLCLCGCGAAAPAAGTAAPEVTAAPEEAAAVETPSPAPVETPADDEPALAPILAEIRERMHPATAGSSLTAAQLAVLLLDWSVQTTADEAQIRAAAADFLAALSESERSEFAEQMSAVQGAAERLRGEEGAALMEDIGGTEGTLWPWADAPHEKLDALFSAAG